MVNSSTPTTVTNKCMQLRKKSSNCESGVPKWNLAFVVFGTYVSMSTAAIALAHRRA